MVSTARKRCNCCWMPLVGYFRPLNDWIGIIMLFIIVMGWSYGYLMLLFGVLVNRWYLSDLPFVFLLSIFLSGGLCLISLLKVASSDPGYLTAKDVAGCEARQCKTCLLPKPWGYHHCSRCRRCVLGMDHHCPWVDNCIGIGNRWLFITLLAWAAIFSFQGSIVMMFDLYYWPGCDGCFRFGDLLGFEMTQSLVANSYNFRVGLFSVGVGFFWGVCGLLGFQFIVMMRQQTTIEMFSPHRPPFSIAGGRRYIRYVFGDAPIWQWIWPFRIRSWTPPASLYDV